MRRFSQLAKGRYLLVALLAGLLLTFCFPRHGRAPVAWVALVPLFFLSSGNEPVASFSLGWIAGLSHGFGLLYWVNYVLNHYGYLPLPLSLAVCFLLVAYLALYPALFCAGLSWLRQRNLPWVVYAPFLWVALEFGKSRLLTGFPWENLGYSQYQWLPCIQLADLAGVYGISFILVVFNALLYCCLCSLKAAKQLRSRLVPLLLAGFLVLAVYGYGRWRLTTLLHNSGAAIRVALVQGNIAQETKWDPAFQHATLDRYIELSRKAVGCREPADLIIWPETAVPFYFSRDLANSRLLIQAVGRLSRPLLFGSPAYGYRDSQVKFFNRAYLLNRGGRVSGYYDKIHLVPFGEYVPWKRLLFFVNRLVPAAGDFAPGPGPVVLNSPPAKIGLLICYEAIFPELSRNLVRAGANLLVNITNDAWFGRSSAPYQHLSMAVLRAVENHVSLARCANTGITAFIDAAGHICQATRLFEPAVITATVPLGASNTIYCRWGDWLAWTCLGISLLAAAYSCGRQRHR